VEKSGKAKRAGFLPVNARGRVFLPVINN